MLKSSQPYIPAAQTADTIGKAEPLRDELFSAYQMERHGERLAESHKLSETFPKDELLSRLHENQEIISRACNVMIDAVKSQRLITPAAEWLLDNYYLIEEQINLSRKHLPKGYSLALPRLQQGNITGLPRVYTLAVETISHSDARLDLESLSRFVTAYQRTMPLSLGELWAIPIMLRLALIENLRRISARLAVERQGIDTADYWAAKMMETAEKDPTNLILVIADMARSNPPMEGSFVAELVRHLQGHGSALALPLTWVEQRLAESHLTIEQLIRLEIQQQTADQVSISNSISSLRLIGTTNWRNFVESVSVVEGILRQDPAGVYAQMDFATRDAYRHSIEKIAKYSHLPERDVALKALELARQETGVSSRKRHIGYFLIDKGQLTLEQEAKMTLPLRDKILRPMCDKPLKFYLGAIAVLTLCFTGVLAYEAHAGGAKDGLLALIVVLSCIGTSQLSIALVNWFTTLLAKPHYMPRMDFSKGIPAESRTLVVVPTLITTNSAIDSLCEAMEIRYLSNPDKNLLFCLLTDFTDADTEVLPQDAGLIAHAKQRVMELNAHYATDSGDIFFLLHRPRRWNQQEKCWMGYERKRGKLGDLNALLQEGKNAFSESVGNTEQLRGIPYVITLDSDTQLPREAAWQLVSSIAHPLNRPVYDAAKCRVTEGYGIIQPRVASTLPGNNASLYAQLSGGEPGIDPYTRTVSDVYQDIFREGSFVGKGIYDVAAFEKALKGQFPENRILSHDLVEGCYTRSALLSDVQLYEEYPSRYSADVSRRHRWVRGDWQLINWVFPRVPGIDGKKHKNPLSSLSRWKIFDNLRRSMVSLSLVLLLVIGWKYLQSPLFWMLSIAAIFLIPSLTSSLFDLARKSKDVSMRQHILSTLKSAERHFANALFALASLPHEAFYQTDAVLRALWRMCISRRKLLEWNPSSEAIRMPDNGLAAAYRQMWIAPALAFYLGMVLFGKTDNHPLTTLLLLLWLFFPAITWRLSQPISRKHAELTDPQRNYLNKLSRKTWAYFETYVTAEDNWLPPDNVQEEPVAVIAHRTSPTNIGLSLLANLTAYDFGYIPLLECATRTQDALYTMGKLERYRGHFYNWYDTKSLVPLNPLYVSAVDSGNLAGHLITLRAGLQAMGDDPIVHRRLFKGLYDTCEIIKDYAPPSPELDSLHKAAQALEKEVFISLHSIRANLEKLTLLAEAVLSLQDMKAEGYWWTASFIKQCASSILSLDQLVPWISHADFANWHAQWPELDYVPTLNELASCEPSSHWPAGLTSLVEQGRALAREKRMTIALLAEQASEISHMEFGFLYDEGNHLLAIGYNVADRRRDTGYYDLLASEARLTSFIAIAQGQLPQESWFALSRRLMVASGKPILQSWSGSMFEYLMPLLVMPNFEKTLLDQTYQAVIKRQIEYGVQKQVPWGISESGYYVFDTNLNYQYRAFGVPGLGMKRGLADDLVIAPYASTMALMVAPEEATQNLQRLSAAGFEGRYGHYEAIDYTPSRLPRGKTHVVVQSHMVHHLGMSFLSFAYVLLDQPMQRRFKSDPLMQSNMLLLHEKIPRAVSSDTQSADLEVLRVTSSVTATETPIRILNTPNTALPEVNLLSNGRYHVMVTNSGGGMSRWRDLAVTRWREDTTRDHYGTFCYVRDTETGSFWSSAYQPTLTKPDTYEAIFSEGRAEFRRRDGDFDMHTEIVVSPEDDIEIRRSRITNRSNRPRMIDITSYSEIVLALSAADSAHPAFSNLFVQTEILRKRRAIVCTRRPRSDKETPPFMFCLMSVHDAASNISFETDRMAFIGRGNTIAAPQAMRMPGPLAGGEGSVLDPIVAIRHQITIQPDQTVTVDSISGISETKAGCLSLVDKYQDRNIADRAFELSWTHAQIILRQLNANEADAQIFARLANSLFYPNASLRADPGVLVKNRRGQSGLWSYAISGDLPIVLLQITDAANISMVHQLVQAHAYWRLKGLAIDLVIWNDDSVGYRQALQEQIFGLIAAGIEAHVIDRPGGIFVRPGDQISSEDRILIESVARVIISDKKGPLMEQLNRPAIRDGRTAPLVASHSPRYPKMHAMPPQNLRLFNGLGGFSEDGNEYVISRTPGQVTPAPWANVIANPYFGTVISENGQSYTWNENAHSFRLTPWHNDPVSDTSGEAFYLRDEETGQSWSPTLCNQDSVSPYVTRHGFGYSVFEHTENGIHSELWVYVAVDAPVKFSVLKVRNLSGRTRQLSATGYVEWVLGDIKSKNAMHVITEVDSATGAVTARNAYNTEFAESTVFFDVDEPARTITGDRREFIGRNGSLQNPAALKRLKLSGKVGPGLDPCAAIQVPFELFDGQERDIIFRMGVAGRAGGNASSFIRRFRGAAAARDILEAVHAEWSVTLGAVQVETPDESLNILANGWLMYQTVACRLWARSGYYQSGGAFGFRDQLQDVMALIHTKPQWCRRHLLVCAAHQFIEGDVQHWWHPPSDRGVRTKCSDDYLWLPLATSRYVTATGDTGVLDEQAHFLEGRELTAEEDSYYDLPNRSDQKASLYEHCRRAILRGLRFGEHGLPLIGSCDWNDGMDKVGEHGKGESVWLAFFFYDVLIRFIDIANIYEDAEFAERCRREAQLLQENIRKNGWDGEWYRRAYFDDGTPLGSSQNAECQIDSISQSWSALSGAGDPERIESGMKALDKRLVRRDASLIQLLDPPFDKAGQNPGYIRGYVPGVRENGGQYTHAAIWTVMAFAKMGEREKAWELLQMINPLNHGRTPEEVALYKVEPYVVAADVYGVSPHTGRGGWTWYTGSSGWMYRLILESILGVELKVDRLTINPCIPADWDGFKLSYRYRNTVYNIVVRQVKSATAATVCILDGEKQSCMDIMLKDDMEPHEIEMVIVTP